MAQRRRWLLNGVGGALLILSLFGAGCQSHTASEPIGKLSRKDTIAYLVLSDQLAGIRESVKRPFTVCISVDTQTEEADAEPSTELLARLIDDNASSGGQLVLKPQSACGTDGASVIDRSSGGGAYNVYLEASDKPECGQYLGGWHGGTMYGGGNFYAVEEDAATVSVSRTNCQRFE